jgi:biopolymer transport protein ExbD
MQLNGGSVGSDLQSEINITPLVDVVLVLLIIFMVVVPLMLQGYDIDIPRASTETVPEEAEMTQVVLMIGATACQVLVPPAGEGLPADCRVDLDNQEIPVADLPKRVGELLGARPPEQRVLFLATDDRLNYEGVLRIVDLAKSGVEDLRIEFITAD